MGRRLNQSLSALSIVYRARAKMMRCDENREEIEKGGGRYMWEMMKIDPLCLRVRAILTAPPPPLQFQPPPFISSCYRYSQQ